MLQALGHDHETCPIPKQALEKVATAVEEDEEIAAEIGMPVGSIGPTRRRCLDKLRSSLEKGGQL